MFDYKMILEKNPMHLGILVLVLSVLFFHQATPERIYLNTEVLSQYSNSFHRPWIPFLKSCPRHMLFPNDSACFNFSLKKRALCCNRIYHHDEVIPF